MFKTNVIVFAVALFLAFTLKAEAYSISDNYYGGTPTDIKSGNKNRDVIGDKNYYDISGMDVNFQGNIMTVDIFSTFFSKLGTNKVWTDNTKLGDLFISTTGWNPFGSQSDYYSNDKYGNTGTNWNFAVVLDKHVPTSNKDSTRSGTVSLYAVKDGNIILSSAPHGSIYREGQMVQFDPNKNVMPITTGTWNITDVKGTSYDELSITLDFEDLLKNAPSGTNNWGFHWAATCANDVIEGKAPTPVPLPEPSVLLLTGLGLLGSGGFLRKRRS